MEPPDIDMNPEGVRGVAAQLRESADTAKDRMGSLFHSGNEASAAHAGWETAAALRECGHTWWKELTTLVDQTAWIGWQLDQSANATQQVDARTSENMASVLGGLES
ncbi:hypothetical protein [Actinophytocola sp. NPDC049390]|uniref:hypothetical protein n=1 Tax=Actinophytocola sp. NPDC049390 TaxID=3363894 RepID=UPI0037B1655D